MTGEEIWCQSLRAPSKPRRTASDLYWAAIAERATVQSAAHAEDMRQVGIIRDAMIVRGSR